MSADKRVGSLTAEDVDNGESYVISGSGPLYRVGSNAGGNDDDGEPREKWGSNMAFLFAAIGAAIGLGNVVRFPYLAFKYGGAAFLIPYIAAFFFVGLPILALELMLGQQMQKSAIEAFATINPRAWGMGVLACCGGCLTLVYYQVILAWAWIFLYNSFKKDLPWGSTLSSSLRFYCVEVQGQDPSYCASNEPALEPG
jgi:SNF family Na+-dependent transporter